MTERERKPLSEKQLAHNRRIAPLGYQATLWKHFNGDKSAMGLWLFHKCAEKYDPAPWNHAWQRRIPTPVTLFELPKDDDMPF